jgi:hypothetical protein
MGLIAQSVIREERPAPVLGCRALAQDPYASLVLLWESSSYAEILIST